VPAPQLEVETKTQHQTIMESYETQAKAPEKEVVGEMYQQYHEKVGITATFPVPFNLILVKQVHHKW
jgi:hypothetical protein